ncbi:hypothetical protein [Flavobacterium sp.]|uniref:hypothetical protein n=1 Tax=Flavobacterium sp. TaxID=239 RepID=UPI0025EC08EA|nr:hypothetical protein [Flavobacterium sp.]
MKLKLIVVFIFPLLTYSQSNLETAIKGGELLLSGLSILKVSKSDTKGNSKVIESLCVKNKLADKITFKLVGKNAEGDEIKKELVIPKDGKECLLLVPKGIYTYEITLANKEIYKKGEYKFDEDIVMTIKQE